MKRRIKYFVTGWIVLMVINHYFVPYFILALEIILLLLMLAIIIVIQAIKLVTEWKSISGRRVQKLTIVTILFLLTLFNIPNKIIETADWYIFFTKRQNIVEQVERGELKPNVDYNNWVCRLPYRFPPVSHDDNEIGIFENKTTGSITVQFWIFRNFFDSPSTYLIYTTDKEEIQKIREKISRDRSNNWKINENWYRIYGD